MSGFKTLIYIHVHIHVCIYVCYTVLYICIHCIYGHVHTYNKYIRTVSVLLLKVKLAGRVTTSLLARPELLVYCGNDNLIR